MLDLKFIETLRKKRGLSAIRVATYLGMGDTSYYNKINGHRKFTVEELIKLGQLYNTSLDEFVIRKEEECKC